MNCTKFPEIRVQKTRVHKFLFTEARIDNWSKCYVFIIELPYRQNESGIDWLRIGNIEAFYSGKFDTAILTLARSRDSKAVFKKINKII